eukprot:gene38619-biopygen25683
MSIDKGEFVSFLGPSGCGKTTVLRMVAGFETPSTGSIVIDGKDQTSLKPNQRNIGMVFQAYALFPNMDVSSNVAFGLKIAGLPKAEITLRVKEMLEMVRLDHLADRFPYQLSGGQQQRVAIARAIVGRPQVLLADEPTGNLDSKMGAEVIDILLKLNAEGTTVVMVTHDETEARRANRIVRVFDGQLVA